ncbi:MAG: hypothetical protein IH939_03805 [Acidobacteria bacterium]|nr:hypothetical protein [Acidobacteriota bacterium]
MTKRTVLAFGLMMATAWPAVVHGQTVTARLKDVQVQIVQTVGCVEQRGDDAGGWWLTRAAEPTVAKPDVFDETQVEEAKDTAPGSREFQLIGVAEFLDAKSLLEWGDRAQFTTADEVNATNALRKGHTVLVKGLLIDPDGDARINLLSVVGLADTCS